MKAEIRAATDAALGLKVFDTLGALPRTRSPDPIICGQIYVPRQADISKLRAQQSRELFCDVVARHANAEPLLSASKPKDTVIV